MSNIYDVLNEWQEYTTVNGKTPHKHGYKVNDKGDGKTTTTISTTDNNAPKHMHEIKAWKALATGPDNHTHEIKI
jgi:hypothetical protein